MKEKTRTYYAAGIVNPIMAQVGRYIEHAPHEEVPFFEDKAKAEEYLKNRIHLDGTIQSRIGDFYLPVISTIYTIEVPERHAQQVLDKYMKDGYCMDFINPFWVREISTTISDDYLHLNARTLNETIERGQRPSHDEEIKIIQDRIQLLVDFNKKLNEHPHKDEIDMKSSRLAFASLYGAKEPDKDADLDIRLMHKVKQQIKDTLDIQSQSTVLDFYAIYTAKLESTDASMNPEARVMSAMTEAISAYAAQLPPAASIAMKAIGNENNLRGMIDELEREEDTRDTQQDRNGNGILDNTDMVNNAILHANRKASQDEAKQAAAEKEAAMDKLYNKPDKPDEPDKDETSRDD